MNAPEPDSPEWRALHGVRRQPQCPRCGTTPPELVEGANGPECADCGGQSTDLFLWPIPGPASEPKEPQP
jgi:hypothetical protein